MSRALVKTGYRDLATGSVADVAKRDSVSLQEAFLNVDHVIVLDVSGSMNQRDASGGRLRHDVAEEETRFLQEKYPGEIALVCFSTRVEYCPHGVPIRMDKFTDLAGALEFCQPFDGVVKQFYVICDGGPDSESAALAVARKYQSPINAIYVGPDSGWGVQEAKNFMRQLANVGGGKNINAKEIARLAQPFETLKLAGGK